jgi:UDP-4-amino-4,6-dideoxy-N-acetyl-beta-L-altrosamine N-acetyltransferase
MTVRLRPLAPDDRNRVLAWRNAEHVRSNMYDDRVIDADSHSAWFDATLAASEREDRIISVDDRPAGLVSLYEIDATARTCSWAFYVGEPDMTGKGVGSAVERPVLKYVFEELGFERLNCEVLERNAPALCLHQRFGFRITGRLPAQARRPDGPLDALVLQQTRAEYLRWRAENP